MKRLFIAMPIAGKTKDAIKACRLHDIDGIRYVPLNQLHITLRFLGDTDEQKQMLLADALKSIEAPPMDVMLTDPCFFGKPRHPSVFAIGIEPVPKLMTLQAQIEKVAMELGYAPEEGEFTPHATVARFKRRFRFARDNGKLVSSHQNLRRRRLRANHFVLYSSSLGAEGATHHVEQRYSLGQ